MKKTLLQIVQDILNDMDADSVNSIDDTIESQQVAQIVQTCYEEMLGNRNWPHLKKLVQLEASIDITKPNYLRLPEGLKELSSFKYDSRKVGDTSPQYRDVVYKTQNAFLDIVNHRQVGSGSAVEITDFSGVKLLIVDNTAPRYWTSFDDVYVVTDSYDSAVDNTLQQSKSQCFAVVLPPFTREDSFIPDLPAEAFPALIEEAKSTAFFVLKQMTNSKAEQKASRQQRWLSRKAFRTGGGIQYPDYGRKGRK